MELALLVYVISLLPTIGGAFALVAVLGWVPTAGMWLAWGDDLFKTRFWPAMFTVVWLFSVLMAVLIPTEKTAYLMVGAYATQKIAEAPKTKELGADVLKIIESKIKFYAEESAKELEEKLAKEKK